ncbi:hypothetical protein [Chroococcus sp. FPU101]|uniref:hypothetical protein n=1 Tax=Chroococcus sp. FPU101 TaxID=1974212 RepID=UPI001A8E5FF7|nr:hypothetical protein [Chroococcus sp. FPU101]GFE69035.1 hypothetical protein CFPU101_16450 [Chroococcus sp. FPU101]
MTITTQTEQSIIESLEIDQIQVRYRKLDEYRDQSLWLFNFSIHGGRRSYTLEWKTLGIKKETIEYLKKRNIKEPKIPFLDTLNSYLNKLNYFAKKRLKNDKLMRYIEPNWFTIENNLEEITRNFQKLKRKRNVYLTKILSLYESQKDESVKVIKQLLTTNDLEISEQEIIIAKFLKSFPTPEQIKEDFYIEITQLTRIPSIAEQSKIDAELAESELRRTQAKIAQELQNEYKQNLQKQLTTVIKTATNEFCEILADVLPKLTTLSQNKLSDRSVSKLQEALLRCQNLINFDQSLKGLSNDLDLLIQVSKDNNQQLIDQAINNLKVALSEETTLLTTEGKGHRALAEWMIL